MTNKGYEINQSPLYKLSSKRKLAAILQIEYQPTSRQGLD